MSELKVKWRRLSYGKNTDPNDLKANLEDYFLRVERMDNKRFWWCVGYKKTEVAFELVHCTTINEAKKCAEAAMWVHRTTMRRIQHLIIQQG